MTAFFNPDPPAEGEETSYEDVPLFISHVSGKYKYYGTYSQNRWSDKLGHDIQAVHVPASIKEYWAKELANPARPAWVTECLMKHLFPKPEYEGPMPAGTPDGSMSVKLTEEEEQKSARRMKRAMTDYFEELRLWEKEASTKVGLMKKEDLIKSFDKVSDVLCCLLGHMLCILTHGIGGRGREPRPAPPVGVSGVQGVGQGVLRDACEKPG